MAKTVMAPNAEPRRLPRASRRAEVAPFLAMDVLTESRRLEQLGRTVMHLELGEPGAPAPAPARAAAGRALATGRIGYTEALGLPALRQRISRHYRDHHGLDVPSGRIVVTTGSSGGFTLAFLAAFDAGQRVAIASPGYPAYRNILTALGLNVVEIATAESDRYLLTPAAIEAAHQEARLDGVLAMSPANPTGVMMEGPAIEAIAETCRRLGLWFVSDEIYHGLTYEADAETALRFSDDLIVVNSFSKYFCMTGWRVGWLVVPERLVRPLECLQQSLAISVPYLSQVAAEAAFDATAELETVRAGYARNRALLLERLPLLGLGRFAPIDGAFYAYVDVSHLTNDSMEFCRRALSEAGVAMTPGLDFDRRDGHRHVRLSFAGPEGVIAEAVDRLGSWLER